MSAATAAVQAVDGQTILLDRDRCASLQMDKLEVSACCLFRKKYQSDKTTDEINFAEIFRTQHFTDMFVSRELSTSH